MIIVTAPVTTTIIIPVPISGRTTTVVVTVPIAASATAVVTVVSRHHVLHSGV
jgi:hypothetical protein